MADRPITHGPDAWSANPWVSVIGFRVERANIDACANAADPPPPLASGTREETGR